jgi:hypothetical protein
MALTRPVDDGHGSAPFTPTAPFVPTCAAQLKPPQATEPLPTLAQEMLAFQDKLSIAWALNWLIDHVCGVNPFEEMSKAFSGDFEAFSKAGDAAGNLGHYFAAYGRDVRFTQTAVTPFWTGDAADAAATYFKGLADDLIGLEAPLQKMADLAIAFGIATAAGTATAETGIGAVLGVAADAYIAWEARQVWLEALKWHGRAVAAAQGLAGLMGTYLTQIDSVSAKSLPGAYAGVEVPK